MRIKNQEVKIHGYFWVGQERSDQFALPETQSSSCFVRRNFIKVWSSNTCENLYPPFNQMVTNLAFVLSTNTALCQKYNSLSNLCYFQYLDIVFNETCSLLQTSASLRNKLDEFIHFHVERTNMNCVNISIVGQIRLAKILTKYKIETYFLKYDLIDLYPFFTSKYPE